MGATLTRRLLAFARRQPLSPSAVDIDVFIRDLADLIEYSVGQGVAVVLDLDAPDICAWVDRGQLENALLNLAINARDAMPNGGTLHLRSRFDANRDLVSIEVADSGQGMDREVRERIFEPFFTTKAGSGSGLGLSIVYGFVKQSGGDIQLTSAPGKGTSFTLHLPTRARDYMHEEKEAPSGIEFRSTTRSASAARASLCVRNSYSRDSPPKPPGVATTTVERLPGHTSTKSGENVSALAPPHEGAEESVSSTARTRRRMT